MEHEEEQNKSIRAAQARLQHMKICGGHRTEGQYYSALTAEGFDHETAAKVVFGKSIGNGFKPEKED